MNIGVEKWTRVVNGEFPRWDDKLNSDAGWTYKFADTIAKFATDFSEKQGIGTKIQTPDEMAKKYGYGWDLNESETKIKPNTLAKWVAIGGITTIAATAAVALYNRAVPEGEKVTKQKKPLGLDILDLLGSLGLDVAALFAYHGLTKAKA